MQSAQVRAWPPTVFGVNLVAKVSDSSGKPVTRLLVIGEGRAEFDEFNGNHSLAGNRASVDALQKMQTVLLNSPELVAKSPERTISANISVPLSPQSKEEQLKELKRLFNNGLITKDIYLERQTFVLGN